MIPPERTGSALYALNSVLTRARADAYHAGVKDVADVLDVAEYLVRLLAIDLDATEDFRAHLVSIAQKHPEYGIAVDRFDRTPPDRW